MKKLFSILAMVAVMAMCMTSCVSTKKIVYFQGADEQYAQAQKILQQYEMKLKPADQVLIKVTCSDPELLQVFAQDVTMGTFGTSGSSYMQSNGTSMTNVYGFTVSNDGALNLPAVGMIPVEGLTTDEAATVIEKKIIADGLIKDPKVTVRLLNARVAVIGAVSGPRVVSLSSERNSIIDVLAQCNDIDDTGLRYKVKLFREENGMRTMYDLDLTKADIFDSPAFYVQQNDMIYVEPNKSKSIRSSAFYTFLSAASSVLALITTIVSVVFLIKD